MVGIRSPGRALSSLGSRWALSGGNCYIAMAINYLLLPFLVLVAVKGQTINVDLGLGVKKAPTPYLGAAGLTPFLGFNPYMRSISPPKINLDLPHFDVTKLSSAYIGANNLLTPFIGNNPYLGRSINPPELTLDLPHFDVTKLPSAYIGANGLLTPFIGNNPYARTTSPLRINLDLPHFDVEKIPSAYIGVNGLLTPFIGINPYLRRSIDPQTGRFSPVTTPYGPAVPPLGLYQHQRLSLFGDGYANGEYCAFDSACASKDCYYFSCSPSLATGEKCR